MCAAPLCTLPRSATLGLPPGGDGQRSNPVRDGDEGASAGRLFGFRAGGGAGRGDLSLPLRTSFQRVWSRHPRGRRARIAAGPASPGSPSSPRLMRLLRQSVRAEPPLNSRRRTPAAPAQARAVRGARPVIVTGERSSRLPAGPTTGPARPAPCPAQIRRRPPITRPHTGCSCDPGPAVT